MWLYLIEIGFGGFIISLFGLVWSGFNPGGAPTRRAPAWLAAAALFFLLLCYALPRFPRPL